MGGGDFIWGYSERWGRVEDPDSLGYPVGREVMVGRTIGCEKGVFILLPKHNGYYRRKRCEIPKSIKGITITGTVSGFHIDVIKPVLLLSVGERDGSFEQPRLDILKD